MKKLFTGIFLLLFITGSAQVKLPRLISNGMILQRDTKIKIWGDAAAGEKIEIRFLKKTYKVKANSDGYWETYISPVSAGGPYTMTINASNRITLDNILFGDVWFCSGQSNMVHQLNIHDVTYADDIAHANYPDIRQFLIPVTTSLAGPAKDFNNGSWVAAVSENVRPFSAVAYFFARKLYEKYHIPIGLINASVGGTPIEAWTSEEGLKEFPNYQSLIQKNKDTAYVNGIKRKNASANTLMASPVKDRGQIEKWFDINYIPRNWHEINIPGYWEDQGIKDLNGVVWYRKEINLPESMADKAAKVFLGRIVDADILYINGKQVGSTSYQYPQRRYQLPADLLKAGKNIFVIRVTNNMGKGGFVPAKPYCIFYGKDTIDLKGTWQYKVGEVYTPRNGMNNGGGINEANQPSALYNAMVAPAIPYAIKGILWYQGEANTNRADEYAKLQPALISDWRNKWKNPSAPFLYVQLPGFMDYNYLPSESQWAQLREAQLKSLSVDHTAMTVAIDLGEWNDIHPDNKKEVGERLALGAMKLAYGENLEYSGPLFQSAAIEGNRIIISFTHSGRGLMIKDEVELQEFAIAGEDKKFVWAKAKIEGDKVIVWTDEITKPLYVRYAWGDNPVHPNLYNKEGLPASPFRTDN